MDWNATFSPDDFFCGSFVLFVCLFVGKLDGDGWILDCCWHVDSSRYQIGCRNRLVSRKSFDCERNISFERNVNPVQSIDQVSSLVKTHPINLKVNPNNLDNSN